MSRPAIGPRPSRVCQICDAIATRHLHTARASLLAPSSVSRPARATAGLPHVSTAPAPDRRRTLDGVRWLASTGSRRSPPGTVTPEDPATPRPSKPELSSLTDMMAFLLNSTAKITAHNKVPSEADVSAALRACKVVADYITDESVQPQISHMAVELDSTAANLLSLDPNAPRSSSSSSSTTPPPAGAAAGSAAPAPISTQLRKMMDSISRTAYDTLAHPTVFVTPGLLRQYVEVQATLGRPETLPRVFQLYVSKPVARETAGSIAYAKPNPSRAANAIDPEIVETALDTAIEAKNLDAAVGIIENSYTTPAFVRAKVTRRGLLPATAFAATPVAAYGLATNFSLLQNAMDPAVATNVAFAGIVAYVAFTASIGAVAMTTSNDQMRRVTWAPGVPLRQRWVREEERAALDKVACAWGFREKWRYGEEEGEEWEALREYLGQKDMMLDRTELMEGMQ